MSQAELRELYCDRLKCEKQCYIAEQTGINVSVLSQFKNGHIDLYDYLFEKLETYLLTIKQPINIVYSNQVLQLANQSSQYQAEVSRNYN